MSGLTLFGKIIIEKGKVVSTAFSSEDNSVSLSIDGKTYKFPDSSFSLNFTETHAHIVGQGEKLLHPDISCVTGFQNLIDIALNAPQRNDWIFLRGWNADNWTDFPEKPIELLDKAFPNNPIVLVRIDGHAMLVNTLALQRAEISHTSKIEGGLVQIDGDRVPTGLLLDNAMLPVYSAIPRYEKEYVKKLIKASLNDYLSQGVTSIHDMDVWLEYLPIFIDLANDNQLDIDIKSYIRAFDDRYKSKFPYPFKVNNLDICGLKFYADGALGSKGALLHEGYKDDPTNKGIQCISEEDLLNKAEEGCSMGWEIAIHAIGDAGVTLTLNVYEKLRSLGYNNVFRIEHSQIVKAEDLIKYKDLNIMPMVQPIHCTSDTEMALRLLDETTQKRAYPWKSFWELGIFPWGGSDAPIESNSIAEGINAFVRRLSEKSNTINQKERVSLLEALLSYSFDTFYEQKTTLNDDDYLEQLKQSIDSGNFNIVGNSVLQMHADSTILPSEMNSWVRATIKNGRPLYISRESST
ncbi:MAG: amidohydrolase [Candidatus Kapaibacteriales bacterium]